MNPLRWKPLFAVLLGLLMVGVTAGSATALTTQNFDNTGSIPELPKMSIQKGRVFVGGYSFPLRGEMVVLDSKGPSKYEVPVKLVPWYVLGRELTFQIQNEYLSTGTIDEGKLTKLIQILEVIVGKRFSPEDSKTLRSLIAQDIKKEASIVRYEKWLKTHEIRSGVMTTASSSPWLPTIYQPLVDINGDPGWPLGKNPYGSFEGDNGIIKVYWYMHMTEVGPIFEITTVYRDEDDPIWELDKSWDAYRWMHYGRIEDIETFYYYAWYNEANFPSIYSTDEFFDNPFHGPHNDKYGESYKAIYINTWNHAMSAQVDSNPKLKKKVWRPGDYPTKEGTREDAENDY